MTARGSSNGGEAEISSGLGGAGAAGPCALGEKDFDSHVIQAGVPVLVVFTADWCAPCKWLHPYLDEVASRAQNRVLIFLFRFRMVRTVVEFAFSGFVFVCGDIRNFCVYLML